MSTDLIPELATLAADPDRIEDVDRSKVPELLSVVEGLRARLWGRMMEPPTPNGHPLSDMEKASGDRLLDVHEASERMGLTTKQLYRRSDSLPFTRKLGPRTLRFSEKGLEKWLSLR